MYYRYGVSVPSLHIESTDWWCLHVTQNSSRDGCECCGFPQTAGG